MYCRLSNKYLMSICTCLDATIIIITNSNNNTTSSNSTILSLKDIQLGGIVCIAQYIYDQLSSWLVLIIEKYK